jgi:hypothetical protein
MGYLIPFGTGVLCGVLLCFAALLGALRKPKPTKSVLCVLGVHDWNPSEVVEGRTIHRCRRCELTIKGIPELVHPRETQMS